jgi:ABC-2 type transport system permease protein
MRYGFQEIKDYIDIKLFLTAAAWTVLFNYLSYLKLKKSDI